MADDNKRITFEEAKALFPDEWIVFSEPRINMENTEFIDGVVHFHSKDRDLAFEMCGKVDGDTALEFTGEPHYRKVVLSTDASSNATSKAA